MNLKIGTIIRKLRTENNITQEALAAAIGVTPQAISRWEAEGGYPDIELLPSLADFFAVSTDELLGYRLSEREQELLNIKKEMERLAEVGTVEEQLAFARSAIIRYPSDHEIKSDLATCLYLAWEENHDDAMLKEAESLSISVLEDCNDEDIRYNTIGGLVCIYSATGRPDKALEYINLLTPMKYCRETSKSWGIGDGNTELYIQDEIDKLTDALGLAINNLVLNEDLPNDPSTWDKKIEMMKTANKLYEMIYGDNLMFHHTRLSYNHWIISTYQIAQGKVDDTLDSLEAMCRHAIAYDEAYKNDHGKYFTSIFTDKLVYPEKSKDFHELTEHNACWYRLDRLSHRRYDSIRDNERFVAVIEKLKEYAE